MRDLAKYFDYVISSPEFDENNKKQITLNGVAIIPADSSVDTSDLSNIFTEKNIKSKQLKDEAWQRKNNHAIRFAIAMTFIFLQIHAHLTTLQIV